MNNKVDFLKEAMFHYVEEQALVKECINLMFKKVPGLALNEHVQDKETLGLMLEFMGFGGKDKKAEKRTVVSNEEKQLMASIKAATAASKALRSVNMTDLSSFKDGLAGLVDGLLDVREKEQQLDPVEITPEVRESIDMLFGMAAYVMNIAKYALEKNIKQIWNAYPSSRMRAAMTKYAQHSDKMDMDGMINKINTPLAKRLAGFVGSALDGGNSGGGRLGGAPRE